MRFPLINLKHFPILKSLIPTELPWILWKLVLKNESDFPQEVSCVPLMPLGSFLSRRGSQDQSAGSLVLTYPSELQYFQIMSKTEVESGSSFSQFEEMWYLSRTCVQTAHVHIFHVVYFHFLKILYLSSILTQTGPAEEEIIF